jgi:hypothetical protein
MTIQPDLIALQSMIRKSVSRFSERSCSIEELKRDCALEHDPEVLRQDDARKSSWGAMSRLGA